MLMLLGTDTTAVTGAASFDIFVRNDGDADEAVETFDIKIGYVIGDNKAEQIEIGLPDVGWQQLHFPVLQ